MKIKTVQLLRTPAFIATVFAVLATLFIVGTKTGQSWRNLSIGDTSIIDVKSNTIQVALLLDTSNSMDGLIEQAKSQLWKIVNELSRVKKDGETPDIQIAVYEFGNDYLSAEDGHIRQVTPFTTDMDLVSEKLFALKTNGGKEYCGEAIHQSLKNLHWGRTNGLKMIYVAGNEAFDQGTYTYTDACEEAKTKEVLVNTVYCGKEGEGINLKWKAGATATGGDYMFIDHNQETVYIASPYDDRISELNVQLNTTYIPYGKEGQKCMTNMTAQDSNAGFLNKVNAVDRTVFKCKSNYNSQKWDLVDAFKKDASILEDKAQLPEQYKGKSADEIKADIAAATTKREAIQTEIKDLDKQRRDYVQAEEAKQAADNTDLTLGNSLLKSVQEQAEKNGYVTHN